MPDAPLPAAQPINAGAITLSARTQEISEINGDVILAPRTWVADLLGAPGERVALAAWWLGFGLACGVGSAVLAGRLILAAARWLMGSADAP